MKLVEERGIRLKVPEIGKLSSKNSLFYNPKRVVDRDLTVLLLESLEWKGFTMCDLLAATGVRGIRVCKECSPKKVFFNDIRKTSVKQIKRNLEDNKVSCETSVHCQDANEFLFTHKKGFSYVDVDSFGSCLPFIDASIKFLSNHGLLGLSTFDKSSLVGRYPKKCFRAYFSKPVRSPSEKELGLRILIKQIVVQGARQDKALTPIYSVDLEDHYRVFFHCKKGAGRANKLLENTGFMQGAGPLWTGSLWDKKIAKKVYDIAKKKGWDDPLFELVSEESSVPDSCYFHLPGVCRLVKREIPKTCVVMKKLREKGFECSKTHFSSQGIRTNASLNDLTKMVKKS
ncbi:MAG: hypothetical protein GOU97_03555 [Nanoarchaeota archaeon]|nr:hypothetical protein [Nanoarchaeota archaeon]